VWCEKKGLGIIGRKDRQFISGGENIQPEEIERAILKLPGVEEVVVLPQPSAEFGQRPVAWVKGTLNLQKATGCLQELLPKYKIPVEWHFTEDLPRTKKLTAL
jgi:O-succinylbenzoic acid--CoA ligase